MRAFDIAVATLVLRVLAPRPPQHARRLVPAVDDADAAMLDRDALNRQQTALIASLWPRPGQCILAAHYLQLPAPALFGAALRVSWQAPRRAEEATCAALPQAEGEVRAAWAA